ncbi:unnamed protein product [Cochlearia groenlandica]
MAKDGPNWDGLLKWSLSHADGTRPTRKLSEEERKWFMEAMQSQTVDVVKRMKEITLVMQTPEQVLVEHGVTPEDTEDLLDELQEHVESLDMANDLHSIGGLVPLLEFLRNSHANIRAKAADVVSTIVQNNPRSQEFLMEANGLELLLSNFTSDTNIHAQTQSLGAISSLIRDNKPGVNAFKLANGYAGLKEALASDSVRFQRKALNLLQYLLQEDDSDRNIATKLGLPRVMIHLASSDDAETREAALRGLLELARDKNDESGCNNIEKNDVKLRQLLEERINGICLMSQEDLETVKEERQLVESMWRVCYNEPSSLREKGLVVLPGEDTLPPDVASKLFEPLLRASAANSIASEKKREESLNLL